jgi:hypothetical protein
LCQSAEAIVIGDRYRVFGTDSIFEITADLSDKWEVTIRAPTGQELGGIWMPKETLADGVRTGKLAKA